VPERSDEPPQETAHTAVGTGAAARFWYLSSQHMTLGVVSAHPSDRVLEAPPIARRFVGQPMQSLRQWMSKQPGFRCELVGTGLLPVPEHGPAEAALLIAEDFPAAPSTPPGRGGSTAGDLTRPDRNLTHARLALDRPDLNLTQAGGMEL